MSIKIPSAVMTVLEASRVDGNGLFLPRDLDRPLYVQVNKVLETIGAKWSKGLKCHLLPEDGAQLVERILERGEYSDTKTDFGQFDTPPEIAELVVKIADIEPGMHGLEPSAGTGNIAAELIKAGADIMCYEIDAKRCDALVTRLRPMKGFNMVMQTDFLQNAPPLDALYDVVVMNPPFAKQADIDHVLHAMKFLKPGGRLVAIMSAGVRFRENRKAVEFRQFVEDHQGAFIDLPENAFIQSGTSVRTCVVSMVA